MTSEVELKEIRSLLLKLIKKVDGLNDLVEERLIGCEEPTPEDCCNKRLRGCQEERKVDFSAFVRFDKRDLAPLTKHLLINELSAV